MGTLLCESSTAEEHSVADNDTLESIAGSKCPALGWKILARYNWGADTPAEVRRALCETVGVDFADLLATGLQATPEKMKLKPYTGLSPKLKIPKAWKLDSAAIQRTHTIEVKRKRPATAVAITKLAYFFDPATATCPVDCRYEGEAARATKRDFEVHATGYYRLEYKPLKIVRGGPVTAEIPCGTMSQPDLAQTHIVCENAAAAPGTTSIPWDGASNATVGVLTTPKKIESCCAPYNVLIRYYNDDADKDVRLKLNPFYPRWTLTGPATYTLVDDSLVVKWTIEGQGSSKAKLKMGQLTVWDKDGMVFIAPLTQGQIASGSYDLLNGPVKWDRSQLERKKLPYRIQIQAHSDMEQDNGLALAVMPTQVPPYAYEQVQLIGFNVQNDTLGTDYRGDDTPSTDIEERCRVMIEAIQLSFGSVDTDPDPKILKVFVAPEFYFRGTNGAYPVGDISTIVPRLRQETDQHKYVDWLFVFGTAIGTEKHTLDVRPIAPGEKKLPFQITAVTDATTIEAKLWTNPRVGWLIEQGPVKQAIVSSAEVSKARTDTPAIWTITLADATGLSTGAAEMVEVIVEVEAGAPNMRVRLNSTVCSKIPFNRVTNNAIVIGGLWRLVSGTISQDILKVEPQPDGSYWLTVLSAGYQQGKPFKLLEPVTTEIINVALVQKGWHAPRLGDGSLRQAVTYKEFISPIDFLNTAADFHDLTGQQRNVRLDKTDDQPVLPTAGSTDIGGASPNVVRKPGQAAGSEINLTGLGGGCVLSIHGITFGLEVCLDHAENRLWNFYNEATSNKRAGDPKVQVHLVPSYGMSMGLSPAGKEITALPNGLVFNVDGQRMESVARIWDQAYSCNNHWDKIGVMGAFCDDDQYSVQSGRRVYSCYHTSHAPLPFLTWGPCGHGTWTCSRGFQMLGSGFAPDDTIPVPSSDTAYFNCKGNVQVFPAKALPDPDIV